MHDNDSRSPGGLIGDKGEELARFLGIAGREEAATHGVDVAEFLAFRGLVEAGQAWELNRGRLAAALADGAVEYARTTIRPDLDQAAAFLRVAVDELVEVRETLAARDVHEEAVRA